MPVSGPTVVRRQLGRRLLGLREAAGRTAAEVQAETGISQSKLSRIEKGLVPVKRPDVRELCRVYGSDTAETEALTTLARATFEQGWWEDYADVIPDWFKFYVDLEAVAAHIQTFEDCIVPGELQTAEYATAVYQAERPDEDPQTIERHVNLRLERQEELFGRTPPPQLTVVLGQNVLTRRVGGSTVLAAQIEHLRQLDKRGYVDIRVLPFNAGAHAAMAGAFRILKSGNSEDPDVVYLEVLVGAHYLEKATELKAYRRIFDLIYEQAIPISGFSS